MGKTDKDKINWHRFHGKTKELTADQQEKAAIMDRHGAGLRYGNKRKAEAFLKVERRRTEKRKAKHGQD